MSAVPQPQVSKERKDFYARIDTGHVAPLWEVLHELVTPKPKTPCVPVVWKWDTVLPWIMESGKLITAQEAERRVLVLENPGLRGQSRATHSLYAGLQLVLPGEIARAHRHSQSALRFIMSGDGAYTAVDGERVTMHVGDFIITPSWSWHDHGNPSKEPIIWMDVLDMPIVELLDAQFMEKFPQQSQMTTHTEGASFARYGNTMMPLNYRPRSHTSPLFWYPYERSREALATLARSLTGTLSLEEVLDRVVRHAVTLFDSGVASNASSSPLRERFKLEAAPWAMCRCTWNRSSKGSSNSSAQAMNPLSASMSVSLVRIRSPES